jgi:cytochrome c peroxidase
MAGPIETSIPERSSRSRPTGMYWTMPLRGAWQHPPYFHDRSAATLLNVVEHYERVLGLQLTAAQRTDLAQYLLSL